MWKVLCYQLLVANLTSFKLGSLRKNNGDNKQKTAIFYLNHFLKIFRSLSLLPPSQAAFA